MPSKVHKTSRLNVTANDHPNGGAKPEKAGAMEEMKFTKNKKFRLL